MSGSCRDSAPALSESQAKPKRKLNRLSGYDYSTENAYFITACIENREHTFGRVVEDKVELSKQGEIVKRRISGIPDFFSEVSVLESVIMPNHLHCILMIGDKGKTLSQIVQSLKSACTRQAKKEGAKLMWQRSFYDHIIRDEESYCRIAEYIRNNPLKWSVDVENIKDRKAEEYYAEVIFGKRNAAGGSGK